VQTCALPIYLDLAAQCGGRHADRHLTGKGLAVAYEDLVLFHLDENIQIARGSAAHSGLALARKADPGTGFAASRDVDREGAVLLDPAGAMAGLAGILDDLPLATAGRTGPLDREEPLLGPYPAHARASRAIRGLRRAFRTGAIAVATSNRAGNIDGLLQSAVSFLKRDAQ